MKKVTQTLILLLILTFGACNNQPEKEPQTQKQKNHAELIISLYSLSETEMTTIMSKEGYTLDAKDGDTYDYHKTDKNTVYKIYVYINNSRVSYVSSDVEQLSNISSQCIDWLDSAEQNGYSIMYPNLCSVQFENGKEIEAFSTIAALKEVIKGKKDGQLDNVSVVLFNKSRKAFGFSFEYYDYDNLDYSVEFNMESE